MSDEPYVEEATGLEIAIVGMACRFPGADGLEEFWDNLRNGVESISHFTEDELRELGAPEEDFKHPSYVPVSRLLKQDISLFDAAFFNLNPREAEAMDPQQRLLLELAWEALESAGYDSSTYPGTIGVYAGGCISTYLIQLMSSGNAGLGDTQVQLGNDKDYFATRIAYKLAFGGPSVTVQSACSTSLVATHLASQTLLSGECDIALAGGVNLLVPSIGYIYTEGDIFSPDGQVRPFSADANGTIFGNGLGFVVLKRLEDALEDGDTVRAVIKGSAVTNDSSLRAGFTAPSVDGQRRAIGGALDASGVHPDTVTYVETHGTGTPTGDPIEIAALTSAYRERTQERGYCAIGSVKGNVGHLSSAAGVTGLIKTVLALEHKEIPPSINFTAPNPQIDFESSPFFVNTEHRAWEASATPRRAGVSAFGLGRTNAHLILEEAPAAPPPAAARPWQLLLLSARTEAALEKATDRLAGYLESRAGEIHFPDAAATLQVGRRPFEHRRMLVSSDLDDAVRALAERDPRRLRTRTIEDEKREVAFLFSGQGAQYPGMGRGLYRSEPVFRDAVDRCCEKLEPHLGLDLRELLDPQGGATEETGDKLRETRYTQPALFVTEYAMARLWMSWGLEPDAMIGHSIGEYVAACLAGVFELDAALALVAARGHLMHGLPAGSMLAVPLAEEELAPRLGRQLSIAALNAPGRCVISGPTEAVDAFAERMQQEGVSSTRLRTSHAFHSEMMEPILQPFREEIRKVPLRPPQIRYVSNLSGDWVTDDEATDPDYWSLHLRRTVRFADGVAKLLEDPDRILLEVGPGKTLTSLARRHAARGPGHLLLSSLRHPKDQGVDDLAFALGSLGQLWLAGVEVDWQGFYAHEPRRRIELPSYPFERRRFWIEGSAQGPAVAPGRDETKPRELEDWFYLPAWKPTVPPVALQETEETWLLFVDGEGLGGSVAELLRDTGQRVIEVREGAAFERAADHAFAIRPGAREDYKDLVDQLEKDGLMPRLVMHLWNVTAGPEPLEPTLERAFYSLLFLAQALGIRKLDDGVRLGVVSSNTFRVPAAGKDESVLCPEKATLLGPCQVLGHEYPHLRAKSLDVVLPADDVAGLRRTAARLIAETAALGPQDSGSVVAYRRGQRWQRDYDAVKIDRTAEDELRLRRRGTYLITGGLGGFGLTFADFLARDFQANLVLVGRTALPERESWDEWLKDRPDDRTSRRIRQIRELEEQGARILVLAADITDREAAQRVVERSRERFGEIHGVIHAAGVPGGGLMQLKDPAAARDVLAPKVQGTLALAAALESAPPDFLVLCSSTIAVLGTVGQVDYCAANCFLDAFAESRADNGRPTLVSVNWGAWQEVGMAAETPVAASAAKAQAAPPPVDPADAVHPLLERCLTESADRAVYSTHLSSQRHWVLDEHRILGKPTVPGTVWLELARAAYAHHTGNRGPLEVSRLMFIQPLQVEEGAFREMRVILDHAEEAGGGPSFRFRTESGGDGAWISHASAQVGPLAAREARHDLDAIRRRCRELEIEDVGKREELVYWGPRWNSLRRLYVGDREGLAKLRLDDDYAADCDEMELHPALVDVATALSSGLTEGGSYLPLSYARICVHGPLPVAFGAYIRVLSEDLAGEIMSADVSFVDGEGRELVGIERFTMKRLGAARSRFAPQDAPAPDAPAPDAVPGNGQGLFAAGGMRPAEGVEVLRRVLSRLSWPRVVVSNRDLGRLRRQLAAGGDADLTAVAEGAALPSATHPRPDLSTPFVAPRNDNERRLAEIWESALGVEQVGIHDNFFDLGGDSMVGIQVVSMANQAGLELGPDQLFEHQTVAELAPLMGSAPAASETQEGVPEAGGDMPDFSDSGLASGELEKVLAKLKEASV